MLDHDLTIPLSSSPFRNLNDSSDNHSSIVEMPDFSSPFPIPNREESIAVFSSTFPNHELSIVPFSSPFPEFRPQHPSPQKRNYDPGNPDNEDSRLLMKRSRIARRPHTFNSIRDQSLSQALGLSDDSEHPKVKEQDTKLWDLIRPQPTPAPAPVAKPKNPAPVSEPKDAAHTSGRYINYHIRIMGAIEPLQPVLEKREPPFRHIWGPEAHNHDIALPFQHLMVTAFPVFLIGTGYSGGGKTNSLFELTVCTMLACRNTTKHVQHISTAAVPGKASNFGCG